MNKHIKNQQTLSREFLTFFEEGNDEVIKKLQKLDSTSTPSIFILLEEMNNLSNESKAQMSYFIRELNFSNEILEVVKNENIINKESTNFNHKCNGLIRFSFIIFKYFNISKLEDFTYSHLEIVKRSLIDEDNF